MYNHNNTQQSKNRVHISWDILYKLKLSTSGNNSLEHNVIFYAVANGDI